jgi:hypothetical protein
VLQSHCLLAAPHNVQNSKGYFDRLPRRCFFCICFLRPAQGLKSTLTQTNAVSILQH